MDLTSLLLKMFCLFFAMYAASGLYKFYIFCRKFHSLPGNTGIPLIGRLFELIAIPDGGRLNWLAKRMEVYKDGFFSMWVGFVPVVHMVKPEHLEVVLTNSVNIDKPLVYKYLRLFMGNGLVTSGSKKWHRDRKFITPAFHVNVLEQYAYVMTKKAEILVETITKELKSDPDKEVNGQPYFARCAVDIICETAMGVNVHAQDENRLDFVDNVDLYLTLFLKHLNCPWHFISLVRYFSNDGQRLTTCVHNMKEFTRKVIFEKRQQRQQRKEQNKDGNGSDESDDGVRKRKRKAFLDLLLDLNDHENVLSDEDLTDQVNTFTIAGYETSATSMLWTLFCLGNNLDIQEKVHKELEEVFGDSDEPATLAQISQLKYLNRAIKEGLRLYPSVPYIGRQLITDLQIGKYLVPKGSNLMLTFWATHRDPDHWVDPNKYDPDRFLPERMQTMHPYAYLPFSTGLRTCIGKKFAMLEEEIVLCAVLRKWRVQSMDPPEKIRMFDGITLKSLDDVKFRFIPKK